MPNLNFLIPRAIAVLQVVLTGATLLRSVSGINLPRWETWGCVCNSECWGPCRCQLHPRKLSIMGQKLASSMEDLCSFWVKLPLEWWQIKDRGLLKASFCHDPSILVLGISSLNRNMALPTLQLPNPIEWAIPKSVITHSDHTLMSFTFKLFSKKW